MADVVSESLAGRRFEMQIALGFALSALLLACLGVYGVVAYSVSVRRAEIGIRIALGAHLARILGLVVVRGLKPVLLGLLAGVAGALLLGRLIRSLLFGISADDPLTLAAAVLAIVTIALLACLVPAWAAARTDPVRALRDSV
jgi:ABC-type antimicrobial peptide transport system permease subunit